jgi:hypothetical protein
MVLGTMLLLASIFAAQADGRVVSDEKRGELPTPSLLIEPRNTRPPRIEVRA